MRENGVCAILSLNTKMTCKTHSQTEGGENSEDIGGAA